MGTWDDKVDDIGLLLIEEKFKLNFIWKSENKDLELVQDVNFKTRPIDSNFPGRSNLHAINFKFAVNKSVLTFCLDILY